MVTHAGASGAVGFKRCLYHSDPLLGLYQLPLIIKGHPGSFDTRAFQTYSNVVFQKATSSYESSSGPHPSLPQFGGPHNRQSRHKRRQLQFSLFLQLLFGGNSLGVCLDYVIPSNGHNCCIMRPAVQASK